MLASGAVPLWRLLATGHRLLNCDALAHSFEGVLSLELLELIGSVLVDELVDGEEATAHAYQDLVLVALDVDALGAELVDTLGFTHKHDLQLRAVGIIVYVLCESMVDRVVLDGDVDGDAALQVDDVLLEDLDFDLCVFETLQQLQGDLVALEDFVLELSHVFRGVVQVVLDARFRLLTLTQVLPTHRQVSSTSTVSVSERTNTSVD